MVTYREPPAPKPEEKPAVSYRREVREPPAPKPSPEPYVSYRREMREVPYTPTPTPAPAPITSYETKTRAGYSQPSPLTQPAYAPSPFRPQPTFIPYSPSPTYEKWRPTREFYMEKLEEMRKKRLAKIPEAKPEAKPVMPAIPPTIKFGVYEVKTEYVAIGATLALIIITVVLLT